MTALYGVRGGDGRALGWKLLAAAARRSWGWGDLPEAARSPRGKPFFPGMPDRCFSLSHSGGIALCALSEGPVGVDVELVRPRRPGLIARCLSPEELARFDGSWEDFYRLWTLKESWCKMRDVPLWPPRQAPAPPPCPHGSYAGPDWRGAVCCAGAAPARILWLAPEEL